MNFTKIMPWNIENLKLVYENTSSGHWFDKDTMRFFKSRLTAHFKRIDDKTAYFITTEQGPNGKRLASVRKAVIQDYTREDGALVSKVKIETVGEFNALSLYNAKKVLKELV